MSTEPKKPKYNGDSLRKEGGAWLERIEGAEKRESEWMKAAGEAEKVFAVGDAENFGLGATYEFNILHSNVETIVPAIYNSTPVPDIRRRRVDATGPEPVPPQAQEGMPPDPQAMMEFQAMASEYQRKEQADKDAKTYGDMLERAITVQIDDNRLDIEVESVAQDSFLSGRGICRIRLEAEEDGTNPKITFEAVSWRDFRMGPAKRWVDVPWVAFKQTLSRETFAQIKDKELFDAQRTDEKPPTDTADDKNDIVVWEVWCALSKTVKFIRADDGRIVKMEDDPMGLPGFYPMPPPVQPITLTGRMTPVCPFQVYRRLADELDVATKRINKIMNGLKLRGVMAGNAEKLLSLAEAGDNELVVESDLEQIIQTGGLDKAIAWWPVEKAIAILAQLYQQREQVKSAIYEITGISDIVRGASNANETLGAQEIKTKWGSLRIQKMQRMISRHVRDIFVICAHLISTHFDKEALVQMTGVEINEGVAALMDSPIQANYRVDVESDSTVKADLTNKKAEMAELLAGTANFFQSAAPLVAQAPETAEPLTEIYAAMTRNYSLGKAAEDALERFVGITKRATENPPPNPEEERLKAEAAFKEKELDLKSKSEMAKAFLESQRIEIDREKVTLDAGKAKEDSAIKMAQIHGKKTETGEIELMEEKNAQMLMDAIGLMAQQIEASNQAMMAGLQQIAATVSAPKRTEIINDENGNPVGAVQTPMVN